MSVKSELRREVKEFRRAIDNKSEISYRIKNSLFSSDIFKNAETILTYVSLNDEVETDGIIEGALSLGKRVAVPYCIDNKGHMDFYFIKSLDDLHTGSFNVREPDIHKCKKISEFAGAIILVPALCFDKKGYRLGYGKGYYDRFLQNYPFISVGLCYNSLIKNELPVGEYDMRVNYIITEDRIINCYDGGKNG